MKGEENAEVSWGFFLSHHLRDCSYVYIVHVSNSIFLCDTHFIMEAVKRFFSSAHFAVAGASNDPNKFGYKRMQQ